MKPSREHHLVRAGEPQAKGQVFEYLTDALARPSG